MRDKMYISGKTSGLPIEAAREKFSAASKSVRALGYAPVNPLDNGEAPEASWYSHMAVDIITMLECRAVYMLKDWTQSTGARLEHEIAMKLGKLIIYEPKEDLI